MRKQYFRSMHLYIGTVQDVEPLMLVHYSPGVALIVRKVQIDRDRFRLYLHKDSEAELATTLTVKFPTPLSNELTESPLIDDAITRFVLCTHIQRWTELLERDHRIDTVAVGRGSNFPRPPERVHLRVAPSGAAPFCSEPHRDSKHSVRPSSVPHRLDVVIDSRK